MKRVSSVKSNLTVLLSGCIRGGRVQAVTSNNLLHISVEVAVGFYWPEEHLMGGVYTHVFKEYQAL